MSGPDYILDLSGDGTDAPARPPLRQPPRERRPWIAIRWKCCSTYGRIYRNKQATAYKGNCPKCGRMVNVKVGPGGTNSRFFEAT